MHTKSSKALIRQLLISLIALVSLTGCLSGGKYKQPTHDLARLLGAKTTNIVMEFEDPSFDRSYYYLVFRSSKELTLRDIAGAIRLSNPRASFSETKPTSIVAYSYLVETSAQIGSPTIKEAKIVGGDLHKPGSGNKSWFISWNDSKGQSTYVDITYIPYSPSTGFLEINGMPVTEAIVSISVF